MSEVDGKPLAARETREGYEFLWGERVMGTVSHSTLFLATARNEYREVLEGAAAAAMERIEREQNAIDDSVRPDER